MLALGGQVICITGTQLIATTIRTQRGTMMREVEIIFILIVDN